jgi:hypothetical protein
MLKTEHCVTGPTGTGKSHLAQAIGLAAIQQGYRVLYRETHTLLDQIAEATIDGSRNQHMELLATVPLLIIDDLGMRKLPSTAAEDLLEIVMRRYERASTLMTSNRLCGAPHKRFEVIIEDSMENSVQSWHRRTPSDPLIKSQSHSEPGHNINKKIQLFRSRLAFSSTMEGVCSDQVQAQNKHSCA